MEVVIPAIVLALLVAALIIQPFRTGAPDDTGSDERADLEAAKEAKYREIRDAELDHRMGKSSEEDWRELDRELRAQAIDILASLDKLEDG